MRIGALARQTGVSKRLLRYYEEQGMLRPGRDANGYRQYADTDVALVRNIRYLLRTGMSTNIIAGLLHCIGDDEGRPAPSPCPGLINELQQQQTRVAEAIERLRGSQRALESLLVAAGVDTQAKPGAPS